MSSVSHNRLISVHRHYNWCGLGLAVSLHRLEGGEWPQFRPSSVSGFPQVLERAGRWLHDQV